MREQRGDDENGEGSSTRHSPEVKVKVVGKPLD